ncbi:MAG: winged helix-turn-helix transcriptional regulator [Myxococcales bacterium]|nr:helix-turn-helix transcriptional regulator [Myxococcales bacterium]
MQRPVPACQRFHTAADLLGKRWTALIVQALITRPRRYCELVQALDAVSERMLIQRLKELERAGVIQRRVLDERPVGVEYRLTNMGRGLGRVVDELERWADQWIPATK